MACRLFLSLLAAVAACAVTGALIQGLLYAHLERKHATHLVILIASLGTLAVMQNIIAAVYTPNILQFPLPWSSQVITVGGNVRLTVIQLWIAVASVAVYAGLMWFAHRTILGKQMRAVASNPFLAEITRLRPRRVHIYRDGDRLCRGVRARRAATGRSRACNLIMA